MKEKIYIETKPVDERGCYSLYYQVRKLLGYLGGNYSFTKDYKEADYIIVLSCIVVPKFINENIKLIERYIKTDAQIILYGCMSKPLLEMFLQRFGEHIHIITHESEDNFDSIFTEAQIKFKDSEEYSKLITDEDKKDIFIESKKSSNHIVINKGCKHNCSFCIIREGKKIKTIDIFTILQNIKIKLKKGISHFRITSDDISTYGVDNNADFFGLIYSILEIDKDITLELGPMYPSFILKNKSAFHSLFKTGKITAIFSAIQHREQRVLELMNRGDYNHQEFENIIILFKREFPFIKIATHLIYGFPGENHQEFLSNLKNIGIFDQIQFHMYAPNYKTEKLKLENIDETILFEKRKILEKKLLSLKGHKIYSDHTKVCIVKENFDTKNSATERYF